MRELEKFEKEKVVEIISNLNNISVDEIKETSVLTDDLGIDSLDLVEMVIDLEIEFDCTIPDESYEHVRTVADIFKVVSQFV
jgi:acyl carrier protein